MMSSFAELQAEALTDFRRREALKAPEPVPTQLTAPQPPAENTIQPKVQPQVTTVSSAHTPPPPEVKMTVTQETDYTAARQAHEAAEAKRKAEFDARQAAKQAGRQERLARIAAMSDDDATASAIKRISTDTERLTRRNMKESVGEYIELMCRRNPNIARLALAPEKTMAHCFQYINRKAREYAEEEMEDNGIERSGVYGLDVPDGLVYQWAIDYFDDPDAKEDHKNEEKFVPKPYVPAARKKTPASAAKGKSDKKKSPAKKPKESDGDMEQISLM